MPAARGGAVAFIFVTILLDMLALGLIMPILPELVESFVDNDTASAARILGVFGTAWALMQFFFSPVLGALSDRFGRRPVILLSNLGLGLDYVLMALAPSLAWLFVGRVIAGLPRPPSRPPSPTSPTSPRRSSARSPRPRGRRLRAGFVLGPAMGGLLGATDPRLPFWVAAGFELCQFALWPAGAAGIAAAGPPQRASCWRRASPLGTLAFCAATGAAGTVGGDLPAQTGACGPAGDLRALCRPPLRLGCADPGLDPGDRRHLRDDGAGRGGRARRAAFGERRALMPASAAARRAF